MSNPDPISADSAKSWGIEAHHERMVNGELRFRLMADDGSGYIRTVTADSSGWQNSHYHKGVLETYIVQRGWAGFVELIDDETSWMILRPGAVYTTQPLVPHNVYLPSDAVLHVVKHGDSAGGPDWHAAPELDTVTQNVSEDEIAGRADTSSR